MKTDRPSVICITGGAGLIGSFLTKCLAENKHVNSKIVVIDDFSTGLQSNLFPFKNNIEIREGDLESKSFCNEAFTDCDIVYHLASRAFGIGYSSQNQLEMLIHNERVTTNLIDTLRKVKPKKLLITSSSCVYDDNSQTPIAEAPIFDGYPEYSNRGYGWAKRFLEQKSILLSQETGINLITVRPFNIYGETYKWRGDASQAIPMLVKKILSKEKSIEVWGSGDQRRSYIHALDCARIMHKLMELNYNCGPVNIGTQETVSIKNLVSIISKLSQYKPKINFNIDRPEGRHNKSSNINLLSEILPNFQYSITLEEGMKRMLDWYSKVFDPKNSE